MKNATFLHLDNVNITSLKTHFLSKKKNFEILAEFLEFEFQPKFNKKDKLRKRVDFILKTNEKSKDIEFEIGLQYEYNFLSKMGEKEQIEKICLNILPQIYSFLRGYLFALTERGPFTILLPSVNIIESLKEKAENKKNKSIKTIRKVQPKIGQQLIKKTLS